MFYLDLTLPSGAQNLALDEALLDLAEQAGPDWEVLRVWEPGELLVVVGRSSSAAREVHLDACRTLGIPVLRRPSGGAAVVTGPGCLMYSLVLSHARRPALRVVTQAHQAILGRLARQLAELVPGVHCAGTSDLAWNDRKVSGNSLRSRPSHLLYHGTLLYDFPLKLIERLLAQPPREPEYRAGRGHGEFLANLPATADELKAVLRAAWQARDELQHWPAERTARLVAERYGRAEWNLEAAPGARSQV